MLDQVDYIMLNVSDMNRSVRFYRDLLGMDVKYASEGWTELATGATVLVLQGGGSPLPSREAELQGVPVAGTCTVGFTVPNVHHLHKELSDKGLQFSMPPTARDQGIVLAICHDPDGMAIAFITREDLF